MRVSLKQMSAASILAREEVNKIQLSIACPYCDAKEGEWCRTAYGVTRMPGHETSFHQKRSKLVRNSILKAYEAHGIFNWHASCFLPST